MELITAIVHVLQAMKVLTVKKAAQMASAKLLVQQIKTARHVLTVLQLVSLIQIISKLIVVAIVRILYTVDKPAMLRIVVSVPMMVLGAKMVVIRLLTPKRINVSAHVRMGILVKIAKQLISALWGQAITHVLTTARRLELLDHVFAPVQLA